MSDRKPKVLVYGPAYLDLVIRVGRPLVRPGAAPLDRSVDGVFFINDQTSTSTLELVDTNQKRLILTGLHPAKHPTGTLRLSHPALDFSEIELEPLEIAGDLGGMGAGYAAAMKGTLVSALAGRDDYARHMIETAIAENEIVHKPVIIPDVSTDCTLIVSSGPHGDKLPVGLRGCHARLHANQMHLKGDWDVVVAASMHNELISELLAQHKNCLRVLAPATRNCRERTTRLGLLSRLADFMSLNQYEWEEIEKDDRRSWLAGDAIICVTKGPEGAEISWKNDFGERAFHHVPVFPRSEPPVDTNRAGEAFAAFFLNELWRRGWSKACPRVTQEMIQGAARAGSAAAGLTINMRAFGFPTGSELAGAIERGSV